MFQHRLACCTTLQLTQMQDWWEYWKRRRLKEVENHSTVSFVHCLSWHSLKPPHPSLSPGTLTPHSPGTLTLWAPSPLTLQAPSPLALSRHPHSPTPAQMENPLYDSLHKEVVNPLFDDADDELEDTRIPVHFQTDLGFEDD